MHPAPAVRPSQLGLVLMALGALLFLSSGGALVALLLAARAPGPDTLSQVSGRVKSIERMDVPQSERELRIVIEQAGSDYEMMLQGVDRLPVRDWPLESVVAGDRVVVWYVPDPQARARGTLWQLYRGRQRVVQLEDVAAMVSGRVRRAVPWGAFGLVAGATLFAAGRIRWKRAAVQS